MSPGWEWPLFIVWGAGTGVLIDVTDLTAWEAGLLGALLSWLVAWIAGFMFYQPQRTIEPTPRMAEDEDQG